MKLTDALKTWLRDNKEVTEDADDAVYSKAAAASLVDGSLTNEDFISMTKDPDADKANALTDKFDKLLDALNAQQTKLNEMATTIATPPEMKKVESPITDKTIAGATETDGDVGVKVITADKQYSNTKSQRYFPAKTSRGLSHAKAGDRLAEGGTKGYRYIDELSELDRAVNGAYAKWAFLGPLVAKGIMPKSTITDHDRDLVHYALRNMNWGGMITRFGEEDGIPVNNRRLNDMEVKTVLDDGGNSGGLEIVPIVFDDAIITTPLLHSEFYSRVNVVTIPRGRRIEGASVSNPTLTWNATEATSIALETTASFVAAFDTSIMTVTGSIQIGLDFLSDTPINFGDIVTQNYGQNLMFELDRVVVAGDGSSEPTGIHDQGTSVAFGAAWTYANLVSLMFTVGKAYKQGFDRNRVCWGGQESTYADVRGIATGVTGDTRPVFGLNVGDYMVLDHPFLVNAAYGAAEMNFVNLGRYRMYRRLGMTTTVTTEGTTLARANSLLLLMRARFGGQLEDTSGCAYTSTGAA